MDIVLQLFCDHLCPKQSNYVFGQKEVEYLKYIISAQEVHVDPSKIDAMKNWSHPQTLKILRGFLGLNDYYHKCVKDYGKITNPLTALLKKDDFTWTHDVECAFDKLKQAMCTTPILAMPNFSKPFSIESDACDN